MKALLILGLLLTATAMADQSDTVKSDPAMTQVDPVERLNAQNWGLTTEEWRRSQQLVKGIRGAFSVPNISPIEVLGIHARNDAERRRYAETMARMMHEDALRVIAFQNEYDAAMTRLYGGEAAVDKELGERIVKSRQGSVLGQHKRTANLDTLLNGPVIDRGDKILFFTTLNCTPCTATTQKLLARVRHGDVKADIYVVGAKTVQQIQQLAQSSAIDPALIHQGILTLNFDNGAFLRVVPNAIKATLPQVVRKRGDQLQMVTRDDL